MLSDFNGRRFLDLSTNVSLLHCTTLSTYMMEEEHTIQTEFFITLDSTQEVYIPSNSQESSLQTYTHVFSLEVKMVEILTA